MINLESETIEKTRKLHLANDAKRILAEPLIQNLFASQKKMCFEAFKSLPMGSTIEEYQTVHHDILAVERLENTLANYVVDYNIMISQSDMVEGHI